MKLKNSKKIIVGITGGVAAYKAAELTRLLRKNNHEVKVIMTCAAQQFITPLTMQTLSANTVYTEIFNQQLETELKHISLARWADIILVAPASANFIARLACGLANDLLTTVCLATTSPIAIAPAMNKEMWSNAATEHNIAILQRRGIKIFGPGHGIQACGEVGVGRMLEPLQLLELLNNEIFGTTVSQILKGRSILITAGPTREYLDPIRYLSNNSSGKMGYALAEAAAQAGAEVTLISGPTNLLTPEKVKFLGINSAQEMHDCVMSEVVKSDIFIAAAAVADYRSKNISDKKIKKGKEDLLNLELVLNPDIVTKVAKLPKRPFTVGFAAESCNLEKNASTKLKDKKLDMIVANHIENFASEENNVVIIDKNGRILRLSRSTKNNIAQEIISVIGEKLNFYSSGSF